MDRGEQTSDAYRKPLPSRIGRWLLALLIPASALAIGTVHRGSLIVVGVVAAVVLALVWAIPVARLSRETRWVVGAALFLIGVTALQATPLPHALVDLIAPTNADIWARSLAPLGEPGPALHSISVAPTMTCLQVLRGLVYLAVYLATVRLVAADQAIFVERTIILATTVMAALALAHPAVGAQRVLGIYRPHDIYGFPEHYYAPLLNSNNLTAYLNIGFCVAFASLLSKKPALHRALLGAIALLLAGTSIWASSRGGMGGLALATVMIVVLTTWTTSKRSYLGGQVLVTALIGVTAAVIIGLASSESAQSELVHYSDFSKLDVAKRAMKLAWESPWFGFGRGAFEDVYPRVTGDLRYETFTNPENIVAQWTTEWGIPVSLAAGAVFVWALRPVTVLTSIRPAIGAWTAIVVSVVHDLVDFHLEIPGIMISVAACAAIVTGRRVSTAERAPLRKPVLGLAAVLGASVVVAACTPSESLEDDREALAKRAIDPSVSRDRFRAAARTSMLRHPGEPFLPLMGAVRAQVFGEGSVISWIGAALERYPNFGRAHLVLARSLVRRNPSQARLEYRLAYEYDVDLRDEVMREGMNLVTGVSSAFELVTEGPGRERALESLSGKIVSRLPSTAYVLDAELLRLNPADDAALTRRAEDAVSDLVNQHSYCSSETCASAALAATDANVRAHPDRCEPHLLRARAAVAAAADDPARKRTALDELVKSPERVTERARCQRSILELLRDMGDERRVETMLQALLRSGCGTNADCVDLYVWAAAFEENRGRDVSALVYYKKASQLSEERDDLLLAILRIALKHDLLADAQTAAVALARRHPEDKERAAAAASLEDRVRIQRLSGAGSAGLKFTRPAP